MLFALRKTREVRSERENRKGETGKFNSRTSVTSESKRLRKEMERIGNDGDFFFGFLSFYFVP